MQTLYPLDPLEVRIDFLRFSLARARSRLVAMRILNCPEFLLVENAKLVARKQHRLARLMRRVGMN